MNARDELRDCFLSDSRDRFETAANAYRAEVLAEAADLLTEIGTPITGFVRSEHERGLMYGAERLRRMATTPGYTPNPGARCPVCTRPFEECTCTGTTRAVAEYVTAGKQRLLTAMNTKREDTP